MRLIHWLETHMMACPYKQLTGFDCPGCGMQRSFVALLKGDLFESLHLYPALLPLLFTFGLTAAHLVFGFQNGARNIKYAYIGTTIIVVVSYLLKMFL